MYLDFMNRIETPRTKLSMNNSIGDFAPSQVTVSILYKELTLNSSANLHIRTNGYSKTRIKYGGICNTSANCSINCTNLLNMTLKLPKFKLCQPINKFRKIFRIMDMSK